MKSPFAAASIGLQLATIGLVVGVLLRRNDSADASTAALTARIERLAVGLEGALHRQAEIALFLDQLRQQAQARVSGGAGESAVEAAPQAARGGAAAPAVPATAGAAPESPAASTTPLPATPFPAAMRALLDLKAARQALAVELESGTRNVAPLEAEIRKRRDQLLARGHEAVYVVRREVDLQPYEPERDAAFVRWLLEDVVPPLSSNARDEAFDIARAALVRATNEAPIKFAAARALLAVDRARWWKDVIDVIRLGKASEIGLRAQLLGLFEDEPRPEVIELCRVLLDDARHAAELRTKAVMVLGSQDGAAVNPILRRLVFEEPSQLIRNHAFDALWKRLAASPAERRKVLDDVLAADPAQMPEVLQVKARRLLEELDGAAPGSAGD